MQTFLYDGSFEGILTCVYEAYRLRSMPQIIASDEYQEKFFEKTQFIQTDQNKASRVGQKLKAISLEVFLTVQCCYLSETMHKGDIILKYIQQALLLGKQVDHNYAEPAVCAALDCRRSVTFEAHRFKGLLRFQELQDGSWYAPCEPDHCILPLLANHCRGRFSQQNWIIHDIKRDMAMLFTQGELQLFTHTDLDDIQQKLSSAEKQYQALWKTFFKNIAITERTNPRLQRQFMPKKYWKYLIEKN